MALLTYGLFSFALFLLAAAFWALRIGRRTAFRTRIGYRFRDFAAFPKESGATRRLLGTSAFLDRWLLRGGVRLTPLNVIGWGGSALLAVVLVWRIHGMLAATAMLVALVGAALIWPHIQYRKRAELMVAQIPLFIDQVARALSTGRNLDGALQLAAEETRPPLGEVMARVQQVVDLGEDLNIALRDAADLYDLRELHLLAMAVRISRGYGSSPQEMLQSVGKLIRQREQAQRELRAMTGEVRISAWLLSLLPTAMAFYMVAVNPGYIDAMWHDPTGRNILLIALLMQATGAVILWRMAKSV